MRLIAIKPLKYGTRRMQAGDDFEASNRDGRILIAAKKARDQSKRELGKLPPPPPELVERAAEMTPAAPLPAETEDDLAGLRKEAEALGIDVDGRWGERRLRYQIELAHNTHAEEC